MFPRPNMPFPLSQIIELNKQAAKQPDPPPPIRIEQKAEYIQPQIELPFDPEQQVIDVAKNILLDAQLLEEEVKIKRKQAYEMAPSLRPLSEQVVSEPVNQTFLQDDDISDDEIEIMARAQEHLERSQTRNYTDELETMPAYQVSNPVNTKKTAERFKRNKKVSAES